MPPSYNSDATAIVAQATTTTTTPPSTTPPSDSEAPTSSSTPPNSSTIRVPFRVAAISDDHLIKVLRILKDAHAQFFQREELGLENDITVCKCAS
jgi:hypothetical protein